MLTRASSRIFGTIGPAVVSFDFFDTLYALRRTRKPRVEYSTQVAEEKIERQEFSPQRIRRRRRFAPFASQSKEELARRARLVAEQQYPRSRLRENYLQLHKFRAFDRRLQRYQARIAMEEAVDLEKFFPLRSHDRDLGVHKIAACVTGR